MTPILICGAGPSGLVLALWLVKAGIKVRIIDKLAASGTTSRAIVLHARNLELYHQLGIDTLAVDGGIKFDFGKLWVKGKNVATIKFGEMGTGLSPFPFILNFPQDAHEAMLEQQLRGLGVFVERNVTLSSYSFSGERIIAKLQTADGSIENCETLYLAGCDGAHSVVRKQMGVDFPGGTYDEMFYVADLRVSGPIANGGLNMALDQSDFLAVFPMKGEGNVRVIGTVMKEQGAGDEIRWEDVSRSIIDRLNTKVEAVNWFSHYRVHHRVASHFQKQNVFLLGDAGHIHSPVGGQGMNTGIGDAINLAWKLVAVLRDKANKEILDTYESERIPFARKLVATTDKAFVFVNAQSRFATFMRTRVVPVAAAAAFHLNFVRRLMFQIVSQIQINYRYSLLSAGNSGKLKAGDRLSWVKFDDGKDNFEMLTSREWQFHVYGNAPTSVRKLCEEMLLPLHEFEWDQKFRKSGLRLNAVYFVRPDGYIGLIETGDDIAVIKQYLSKWNILAPKLGG